MQYVRGMDDVKETKWSGPLERNPCPVSRAMVTVSFPAQGK
jgi:hypothetical protein